MNNINYIGSSLFIINLDFSYIFQKDNELNNMKYLKQTEKIMGRNRDKNQLDGIEKYTFNRDSIKTFTNDCNLPLIK